MSAGEGSVLISEGAAAAAASVITGDERDDGSKRVMETISEGWLTKRGAKFKTWKRRWFELDEGEKRLYYFQKKGMDREKHLGFITLDDATCANAVESEGKPDKKKNLFQIVTPARTWYLITETEEERDAWLKTVHSILDKVNPPKEVVRRKVGLEDFKLIKVIGKGNFGKVLLVRMTQTDEIFAMKMLSKKQIIENNEIEHTMAECRILQRLRHPFLVNLHYAFQTEDKLCLILDFVNGGELFFHLQQDKRFSESRTRFYAAEILLGLEYLHNAGVLYRDLKLENLLLTAEGHIVLTDFGLSKEGLDGKDARTTTFCGTPEYMAPEMLSSNAYGKAVDWWSFGSLLYEMLTGLPPFYNQDVQKMYHRIVHDRLSFPPFVNESARGLIALLLEKDPKRRLTDPLLMKRHPFFDGIDWDALYRRKVTPPFVPPVKSAADISQIDPVFTKEAPTLDMTGFVDGGEKSETTSTPATDEAMKTAFSDFSYAETDDH